MQIIRSYSIRIPVEQHEELASIAFHSKRTLQDITSAAIRAYLQDEASATVKKPNAEERQQLAMCLDLLRAAPSDLQRLLVHLIEFWRAERAKLKA